MDVPDEYVLNDIDPGIKCKDLHPCTTCLYEIFYKMRHSFSKAFKFYLILHSIAFLIFKTKHIKDKNKLRE